MRGVFAGAGCCLAVFVAQLAPALGMRANSKQSVMGVKATGAELLKDGGTESMFGGGLAEPHLERQCFPFTSLDRSIAREDISFPVLGLGGAVYIENATKGSPPYSKD